MIFCLLGIHKLSKKNDDGYQYCEKCGKAIIPECVHDWELKDYFTSGYYIKSFSKCKICHKIKKESQER